MSSCYSRDTLKSRALVLALLVVNLYVLGRGTDADRPRPTQLELSLGSLASTDAHTPRLYIYARNDSAQSTIGFYTLFTMFGAGFGQWEGTTTNLVSSHTPRPPVSGTLLIRLRTCLVACLAVL